MTEGIISLTNRDNRHKEGWGREEYGGWGGGGGWVAELMDSFSHRGGKKLQRDTHHPPSIHPPSSSIASNEFLLAGTLMLSQGSSQPPSES